MRAARLVDATGLRLLRGLLLPVAALALAPVASAHAKTPLQPALLAAAAAAPQAADVAVNDAGRAVAVWVERTPVGTAVAVRSRIAPGGPWLPGERLSAARATPVDPVVAIGPTGAAVVVWREEDGPVRSAFRPNPSAPWTRLTVDPAPQGFTRPVVSMTSTGAIAAWAEQTPAGWRARRAALAGGDWRLDPPLDLTSAGVVTSPDAPAEPALAVDRHGDAAVIWPAATAGADQERTMPVVVALRPGDGTGWSAATRLSAAGQQAALALGDDGTAAAVWLEDGAVTTAVRDHDEADWSRPEVLQPAQTGAPPGTGPAFPTVALNDEGYAMAAWGQRDPQPAGLGIEARRRSGASGLWAPARTVAAGIEADAVLELRHMEAVVDGHRTAYLAWLDPEGPGSATVHAAISAGTAWQEGYTLPVREDLSGFALATAAHGGAVLVGQRALADVPPIELVAASFHEPDPVELDAKQLLISQRISQAAVRRANAALARLDDGLTGGDFRDGSLLGADFGAGVRIEGSPGPATIPAGPISPLPIPPPTPRAGRVRLTSGQLLINQRISQAAVRRATAGRARLSAGLTGADVLNGALTARHLAPGLRVVSAVPLPFSASVSASGAAAQYGAAPVRRPVTLSRSQLLINQRIAQAAVLRAGWLVEKLEGGLTGADVRDGGLTAEDLAPELRTG